MDQETKQNTSKVYFTTFRCRPDEGPVNKLKRLVKAAGIGDIDMDGKFVAIKMHFGELGNMAFLRQAVPYRLQYSLPWQPQECHRALVLRMGKRFHAAHCGVSGDNRRRAEGYG